MRFIGALIAMVFLAQCATPGGREDFVVGSGEDALVIIGIAKSGRDTSPRYVMLWRQLDEAGAFRELSGRASFDAETNDGDTVRVRGIPGEFVVLRVEPGVYALDGVFAIIPDGRVNYVAQGVITGPERPTFEARAGEAIYLGIWEADIEDTTAVVRPWRLDSNDARAVVRQAGGVEGEVRVRETHTRAVPCAPHQPSTMSTRRVC
ncbi:MAG: hypothetical protein AB7O98_19070 [Hyphomonadaceae bacterium]